jgi:EAL domain-containing protein (putative c-di-GMP-specific phosphodiesterase class I)
VPVAVNVSAKQLKRSNLPERLVAIAHEFDIAPHQMEVELTESVAMQDSEQHVTKLHALRDLGVRVSVDDFGTGYSSLAHLHRLPIDAIKIDKSFVVRMATEAQDAVIVRSMIHLAHNLNLKVVAEGVENRQTMEMLRKMGCDMAQGYHISHPRPAEEVPRRLDNWLAASSEPAPIMIVP